MFAKIDFSLLIMQLYCSKYSVDDDVHIVGINAFAHQCLSVQVFHFLHTLYLREDKVGVTAHTHIAPRLAVVVVLLQHQLVSSLCVLLVECHSFVGRYIHSVYKRTFELYKPYDSIVDKGYKLLPNTFANTVFTRYLYRANALCLDKKLVGKRRWAQYAPRSTIVVQLL